MVVYIERCWFINMPRKIRRLNVKITGSLYEAVDLMARQAGTELSELVETALRNAIVLYDVKSQTMLPPLAPREEYPRCPFCQTPVTLKDTSIMPKGYCITCLKQTMIEREPHDTPVLVPKVQEDVGVGDDSGGNGFANMLRLPEPSRESIRSPMEETSDMHTDAPESGSGG